MQRSYYFDWRHLPLLLTPDQAGKLLQITPECVRKLCAAGKLPAIQAGKQWRIDAAAIRARLEAKANGGTYERA